MVDMSRVDEASLSAISASRVFTDPIVLDKRATWGADTLSDRVRSDILQARLQLQQTAAVDEPVSVVSWPEVCAYFSTLSLTVPLDADGADMYQWAFYRYLSDSRGLEGDELPEPAASTRELPDHLQTTLHRLRKKLRVAQDRHFLEHRYDADCGVPKAFWTERHNAGSVDLDPEDYELAPVDASAD